MKYIVSIILFLPLFTMASGIEVSPAVLELTDTAELVVANPTPEPAVFEVYAENHRDAIKITPSNFTLDPGERTTVRVALKASSLPLSPTNIAVLSQSPSSASAINTGIKIPVTITGAQPDPAGIKLVISQHIIFLMIVSLLLLALIYQSLRVRNYLR